MQFGQSPFDTLKIPTDAQVVFVSDLFVKDYVGGAELTSEALISSSPYKVWKLHSKDLNSSLIQQGVDKHWIFGNFTGMDFSLIPTIVGNLKYSVLEYDYKFCKHRSVGKHQAIEGTPCDCNQQPIGKMISAFYHGASSLWWMSEDQRHIYQENFPFLKNNTSTVLSSVFDENFFAVLKILRTMYANTDRKGWIVLGSNSWIKGAQQAEKWCVDNNKQYEVVWNVPYETLLDKLAQAEGFVYLPLGDDTCPRMVIEAKLLGCKLQLNEHVQHAHEEWFATDNLLEIEEYLYSARSSFWNAISGIIDRVPSISGYTTTLNCIEQQYPYEQSIHSMLQFCDQVVVVDGGSTDGTWEQLQKMKETETRLKIHQEKRDWNHPRFAVFDGAQKALARSLCTSDYCWQQDSDEIVHEDDVAKIRDLVTKFPKSVQVLALPVVEYWGGYDKVRCDVNPWKWRLSLNLPNITHGIPKSHRKLDAQGNLCAQPGTDGCDMIDKETGEPIPFASFYHPDVHNARMQALQGNHQALLGYQQWLNNVVDNVPGVYHYSWFDLERKIKTYRGYWTRHWNSLFDQNVEDIASNNMFFDCPWSEVTDEMITELAKKMKSELGGWIFHSRVDFSKPTPSLTINHTPPTRMRNS